MNHYYVAKNGQQEGPYSVDQITEKIKSKDLTLNDYVYDSDLNDWVFLSQFAPISKIKVVEKEDNDSWFILKSENKYGPFTQLELVKMLQDKSLFEFDYVWKKSMSSWNQISELNEFSTESIRKMMFTEEDLKSEIFFRRRHARAEYGASIIVHNNIKLWRGNSLELSAGGAGIYMENVSLTPGDTVFLHFQPGDGVPPFNAVCEIVSKKTNLKVIGSGKAKLYGVKFSKIQYGVQKAIKDFATKKVA
jgi:hypothetical protein